MLLKRVELEAIKSGETSVVFRRWRRPTVKTGGSLTTALGVLAIERVRKVDRAEITKRDAAKAGCSSLAALLGELDAREGEIYRIEVRFAGADPRIELREKARLSKSDLEEVQARLARLDATSRTGAWTRRILHTIDDHPRVAAAELSAFLKLDKMWLKQSVRKLKNLGLTISHHPGYELSPRGKAVLAEMKEKR